MKWHMYALGSNSAGQLGIGHKSDVSEPQLCQFGGQESNDNSSTNTVETPIQIVAGGNHTLLLTKDHRLYAAGHCEGTAEETAAAEHAQDAFRKLTLTFEDDGWTEAKKVTHIAATWEASIFVVDSRRIYACGKGGKGELGLGKDVELCRDARLVLDLGMVGDDVSVNTVAAGVHHVVVTTSEGTAHGWGSSRKGQLGEAYAAAKVIWEPSRIDLPFEAEHVAAGRDFTVFTGTGAGPLLRGDRKHFPDDIGVHLQRSGHISCGWTTLYGLDMTSFQAFGRNNRGQLPPPNLPRPIQFAAGSEHCIASTTAGKLIAWGWGEHGNCGLPVDDKGNVAGRFNDIKLPSETFSRIVLLAAGCATTFVVVEDPSHEDEAG